MINRLLSLSIKTKISFTIFISILLFSMGIIYVSKNSLMNNLEKSAINITRNFISSNETLIIKYILEDDYWSIYKLLKSIQSLETIKSIGFINEKNKIIAHTNTSKYPIDTLFEIKKFKGIEIPLVSNTIQLGKFVVILDRKAILKLFEDTKKHILVFIIILAILSFFVANFISNRILKRLNLLSLNAHKIQKGQLEEIKPYLYKEKDEIALFQHSMQIILNQLNESIQNEQKLKEFYHKILKSLNEMILILGEDLNIVYNNTNQFKDYIFSQNRLYENIKSTIEQKLKNNIHKFIIEIPSKENKLLYLYTIIEKIDNQYILSLTDITKLKNLEEQQQLKNSFELIGEISSSVVHEIKNHIQPVKLLIEQEVPDKEDLKRVLNIIHKIDGLISNFLKSGKPIDKSLSQNINIVDVIEEKLFLFSDILNSKSIKIIKNYQESSNVLLVDEDCDLIVLNILKNAIEASFDNETIEISTEHNNTCLMLEVINSGITIDKKNLKNLSKPFFSTKNSGTGFGLYTTYKTVYLYGGYIDVISKDKKTTFKIYLPMKEKNEYCNN
ncbi:sensor histidine kinase [Arcobacter sp.]|uniref:sensor histidine kinase n=1 Tax=Arcobacter sp. TaxID=1872629 RepID=UPI003D123F94